MISPLCRTPKARRKQRGHVYTQLLEAQHRRGDDPEYIEVQYMEDGTVKWRNAS